MADSGYTRFLRDGTWLTAQRLRVYPWILLAGYLLAAVLYVATSHGLIDANGKPLGPDYIDVYAAGQMAQNGDAPAVYDWAKHHQAEQAVLGGRQIPYFGWHYPPLFLLIALPLSLLPYAWSLLLYLGATLAGYAAVIWRVVKQDRSALLLALTFPAVFVNAFHGQNGFLTTALLGGGLLLLEKRPWAAGVLLGCLAYKPQLAALALLMPLVTMRWHVVVSAAVTIAALSLLTMEFFGVETWRAFFASATLTREQVLEAGSTGWEKIQACSQPCACWAAALRSLMSRKSLLHLPPLPPPSGPGGAKPHMPFSARCCAWRRRSSHPTSSITTWCCWRCRSPGLDWKAASTDSCRGK